MSECNKCNGTLFVCENHPDQEAHQCKHCGGAGMPCECTEPVSEWVSVKDRLPKAYQAVLTFSDTGNVIIGRRFSGKKWNFPYFVRVTHWMPLPNPPKEVV